MMKKLLVICAWTLLLGGCENNPAPEETQAPLPPAVKPVSPELQQKIGKLNAGLASLRELAAALSRSDVRSVSEDAAGVSLGFGDGTRLMVVCDAGEAQMPLIGIAAEDGVYYWTLAAAQERSWLKDAAAERMPLTGPAPVMGVDDAGFWTVTRGGEQTPQRVTDAAGKAVEATGEEAVALFRAVTVAEGRVTVALADGGGLSAPKTDDLSAAGTANCYVVTRAGNYLFRATVRGNGVGDEAGTGFTPQIELADDMTADWVWTDAEGLVSKVTLDRQSGEIAFTAGAGRGNVLIALVQGTEIVWSWHVWVTDQPQTMAYGNGAEFLDRNLGAVGTEPGSTEAYGLLYQWGRKDPFYGGAATESSATAFQQAKEHTAVNPTYALLTWGFTKSAVTPAVAAAHPMTFYNNTVGTANNWTASNRTLWSAQKTLNDPCPAGYKVPAVAAWESMSSGRDYIEGVSAWDGANYGMTYIYNGQTAWYPAQGYRNYSAGNYAGLRTSTGGSGAYWSSDSSAAKSYYLFFRSQLSVSGSINPELDKERSCAYSVRCCKE